MKSQKGLYQDKNIRKHPAMLNQSGAGFHKSSRSKGRALRDDVRAREMMEQVQEWKAQRHA
jgi:hypothetical protein